MKSVMKKSAWCSTLSGTPIYTNSYRSVRSSDHTFSASNAFARLLNFFKVEVSYCQTS